MDDFWIVYGVLLGLTASATLGGYIGSRKGRTADGVIWALLLGPFGWLIVALKSDLKNVQCPFCREKVQKAARVCGHCGRNLVEEYAKCPLCSAPIKLRAIKIGQNICPRCQGIFDAE